jgi:hypothetical protein
MLTALEIIMWALWWHLLDILHIKMHIGFLLMLYKLKKLFFRNMGLKHMCNISNNELLCERLKPKRL